MALNFFVHSVAVVVAVAAVQSDFVMELHSEAVHTLADSVVLASPLQKSIEKNYFSSKFSLHPHSCLPLQLEPNAAAARSRVWYNCY